MYVLAWDDPTGLYAYGPFENKDEAFAWYRESISVFVKPEQHRVIGYSMVAPFEQPDHGMVAEVGSCYHQGREFDDRVEEFIATVVVSETVSFGVGPFAAREAAERWFLAQRMRLNGAQGLILPLVPPHG